MIMPIKKLNQKVASMLLITAALFSTQSIFANSIKNQLKKHASPYLAMHGTDPVQWQDWTEDAVNRAKKENKLIFISSGYFSCHWCHVMQRESYKNKNIAKILNEFFIPVKVDRELNPALDARLIDFVEKTQGQAGWPLNVFITPEGYPLVGMTYLPTKNFEQVLNNLKEQWTSKKAYLKTIAKQATIQLLAEQQSQTQTQTQKIAASELTQKFLAQTNELIDEMQGGFGEQNKFPSVPQLRTLLHIIETEQLKSHVKIKWIEFLITTLDSMANLGLNDQVNGGFFRYTVDPNWQIPHFEKMLYDNAQLAALYFEAAKILKKPNYKIIAEQTLDFMQTDMKSNIGIISASLSAVDNKGIEGGYYVFQQGDLKKYLTAQQYTVAKEYWKLVSDDALESGYHLVKNKSTDEISNDLKLSTKQIQAIIQASKLRLKKIRAKKINPIDSKPVAAWLGLSLHAFSLGAQETLNKSYRQTADKLFNFINEKLWRNKTLYRSIKQNGNNIQAIGTTGLEDYALVANGVNSYSTLTKNKKAHMLSIAIAKQAWQRFYKKDGWYLAEKPLIKYIVGKAVLEDSPLPSPSAVIVKVSLELKDKQLNKLAEVALQQGMQDIAEAPFWYASQIDVIRQFRK